MENQIDISVVVPVFNEYETLDEFYTRTSQAVGEAAASFEILFVNDGSTDNSLGKLKSLASTHNEVKYINLSRNFGHQIAVTAGLEHASGKAIVIIDGDLQDPPELIPQLYEKYKEGYHVVYARRTARKGESFLKKFTAKMFYRILSRITSINIPLDTGDYRLIDKQIADELKRMPEQNKFLRGQIAWVGFNQTYVNFEREKRKHGKTGYSVGKMIRFAMDGITGYSNLPLKLATYSGFIVSGFAFIVIIYALYSKFILEQVIGGWTSLLISTMFIGGIQLLCIGIIGEYISRIHTNVKNRPLYIVEQTNLDSD